MALMELWLFHVEGVVLHYACRVLQDPLINRVGGPHAVVRDVQYCMYDPRLLTPSVRAVYVAMGRIVMPTHKHSGPVLSDGLLPPMWLAAQAKKTVAAAARKLVGRKPVSGGGSSAGAGKASESTTDAAFFSKRRIPNTGERAMIASHQAVPWHLVDADTELHFAGFGGVASSVASSATAASSGSVPASTSQPVTGAAASPGVVVAAPSQAVRVLPAAGHTQPLQPAGQPVKAVKRSRNCSGCGKTGHYKSTCPDALQVAVQQAQRLQALEALLAADVDDDENLAYV